MKNLESSKKTAVDPIKRLDALVEKAGNAVVTAARAFDLPGLSDRENLSLLLEASSWFYSGRQQVIDHMLIQADTMGKLINTIPGVVGCFGVGYPFYAIGEDKNAFEISTIGSFISLVKNFLSQHPSDDWACFSCSRLHAGQLKEHCGNCKETTVNPRKLLSSMPDIDIIVVVDQPGTEHETSIESTLHKAGIYQSDLDIPKALAICRDVITDLKCNGTSDKFLPADVHVWNYADLHQCSESILNGRPPKIFTRSMYRTWENDEINCGFDWVFSLSELDKVKPPLSELLDTTRREFSKKVESGSINLIEYLGQSSRRAGDLLAIPEVMTTLEQRVKKWLQ